MPTSPARSPSRSGSSSSNAELPSRMDTSTPVEGVAVASSSGQEGPSTQPSLVIPSSPTDSRFSLRSRHAIAGSFVPSIHLNGNIPEFISKLYTLLQNPQNRDIATWSLEGESFVIKDINEFSRSVIPQHFKHSNFSSFVRQLNKYDFHKVKNAMSASRGTTATDESTVITESGDMTGGKSNQVWEFFHPNFKRDRLDLLALIRRKKTPDSHGFIARPAATPTVGSSSHSSIPQVLMNLSRTRPTYSSSSSTAGKPLGISTGTQPGKPVQPSSSSGAMGSLMALASSTTAANDFDSPTVSQPAYPRMHYPTAESKPKPYTLLNTGRFGRAYDDSYYTSTSSNVATASLTKVVEELGEMHEQVGSIAKMQNDMALALQVISKNYQALIDEYCILRRQVSEQDKILRILLASYQQTHTSEPRSAGSASPDQPQSGIHITVAAPPLSTSPCAASAAALELQTAVHGGLSGFPTPTSTTSAQRSLPTPESPMARDAGGKGGGLGWRVAPRILLVEDDVICRKLSSRILELFGCQIDISPDGSDAVEKVSNNRYDLVLMDIVMPNMDGLTATKRIRSFNTATPIISMTSNISQDDCIVYLSTGMNDILPKPFSKDSVLNLLEKYCAKLKGDSS